ncbi:MAG: O-antigen ligase family protein [bacterium]
MQKTIKYNFSTNNYLIISWIIFLIIELFLLQLCMFSSPLYGFAFILLFAYLIYIFGGNEQLPKAMFLTIIISSILLQTSRKMLFRIEEIPFLFVIGIFTLNNLLGYKSTAKIGKIGLWLTVFLTICVSSAFVGLYRGQSFISVGNDLFMYLFYSLFFFVIRSDLSEKWIKRFIYAIIGITFIITLEYVWMYIGSGGKQRCVSDQQHFLNIGIPLIVSWLLYEKNKLTKLFLSLLLIPMGFAVIITLTRMLWVIIPGSVLLLYFLHLLREGLSTKKFLYGCTVIGVILCFTVLPVKDMLTGKISLPHMVKERSATLKHLAIDPSFLGRLELASYVFPRIKKNPIIGTGLGDTVFYKLITAGAAVIYSSSGKNTPFVTRIPKSRTVVAWLDVSYLNVLWKMGIIGLLAFLGLYVVFVKRCWFVFKNSKYGFEKWSSLGILTGIIGLLFTGVLSAILVGYRFNFAWAALMGIIELQAQRIEKRVQTSNI